MSKVTVVGAGNVGATCANVLAVNEVANQVCLIDIKEGLAEGKAMDIMQTAHLVFRMSPDLRNSSCIASAQLSVCGV